MKCPVCDARKFNVFWAMHDYKLARCLVCGMVWDSCPPKDLESFYNKSYFLNSNPKGGYANYFEGMAINRRTFYERIKRINQRIVKKEKMLDVGSALGDSLVEAKRLGWKDLYGVELSKYAANQSKKKKLKISIGSLRSAKYPSNYFDVVTLQDVIEHFKDPAREVNEIYRILEPGGIVFIVTPDVDGIWSQLLKKMWYHYKPGEHIMYFSQNTLKRILSNHRFKNIETRKTYHVMSVEYILNRLKYYSPFVFGILLKLTKNNIIGKTSFKVYSGEIEAWGQK